MVMGENWSYCSDHFIMFEAIKSLCCVSEANIILYINYYSIKNNFQLYLFREKEKKRDASSVIRGQWKELLFILNLVGISM